MVTEFRDNNPPSRRGKTAMRSFIVDADCESSACKAVTVHLGQEHPQPTFRVDEMQVFYPPLPGIFTVHAIMRFA